MRQLAVTRQDKNLFWAENRWRVDGTQDWVVEDATGTFNLFDPTTLCIIETGPAPVGVNTGLFDGRLKDGKLYLTYKGVGDGVSFSTVLKRK